MSKSKYFNNEYKQYEVYKFEFIAANTNVTVYSYNELHSPYYYTRDEYEYNKSYKIKYTIYDKYKVVDGKNLRISGFVNQNFYV